MRNSNGFMWAVALLAAFGSWLMQQSSTFQWSQITQPLNVGSLLVALTGVLLAGKFITPNQKGQ